MKCSVASPGQGAEDSDQEDTRGTERAPDAVAPDAALHKELVHPVAVRVSVDSSASFAAQSGCPSLFRTMLAYTAGHQVAQHFQETCLNQVLLP